MSRFIDIVSSLSILGIWPRFIEPKLVRTTTLDWKLPEQQRHLDGLKIVQFSDLHFHPKVSDKFLDRVARRILRQKPDIILFTGDFICYSSLEQQERLKSFLNRLQAPLGCFCSFGNHDYANYVSRNSHGLYDVRRPINPVVGICTAVWTIIRTKPEIFHITNDAASTPLHDPLCSLLRQTAFTLLENMTVTLPIGLNVTGLGEYAVGRCRPETAFAGYEKGKPGLVLSHNPDTFPHLRDYPGDWIFCGHTHGEQIHLPFLRPLSRKLARLENPLYTRGLFQERGKKLYVSRGIGSPVPFRFCSAPEVVVVRARYG
ncbi:MAG: UDP-2,3-diacylglucosamine pyrophosphatase LpxG [Chlamydiales bacterium]|nr:UDP-2,3-diacylglucosamine pyrophosphatase LpxG [Chlamydiales bacterium]MCH9635944.1 UDP-2,3-diacylglucosamine pyrophosphatase LpxG [Chlamydiales bacterium]MCH9704466.1 UDP-2,3-diacylglucosamine diphosphatase LpxG [Chlamydiota bacterium]